MIALLLVARPNVFIILRLEKPENGQFDDKEWLRTILSLSGTKYSEYRRATDAAYDSMYSLFCCLGYISEIYLIIETFCIRNAG